MKTLSLFLLCLSFMPSIQAFAIDIEPGPGAYCPVNPNGAREDRCAHIGKRYRDRNGRDCASGFISPYDGDHTAEVKVETLHECFGKDPQGSDYLHCVARHVEQYYRNCPHYRGYF